MRIRKRQVPFPLSSLSPVPISDPLLNLNQPPPVPVVVQLCCDPTAAATSPNDAVMSPNENPSHHRAAHVHPQPSDRPADHHAPPIGKVSGINGPKEKKEEDRSELLLQKGDERGEQKGNYIRKENIMGAKAVSGSFPELTSHSSRVLGNWCEEGERAFPPKKRRGLSFEISGGSSSLPSADYSSKAGSRISKAKANSNKKSWKNDDEDHLEDGAVKDTTKQAKIFNHNGSKKSRGGALMEGSRCSRVNGRGWRCCQQTLVGYSLCEHHLGKGRLRSMTSVRSRSLAKSSTDHTTSNSSNRANHSDVANNKREHEAAIEDEDDHDNINGNEKDEPKITKATVGNSKRKVKLGMVKARSISSLLGQTNGAIPMADLSK